MEELESKLVVELDLEALESVEGGYKRLKEKKGYIIYQISKGDTLRKIAKHFGVSVTKILQWNPKITNKNLIYAGDYLYIKE